MATKVKDSAYAVDSQKSDRVQQGLRNDKTSTKKESGLAKTIQMLEKSLQGARLQFTVLQESLTSLRQKVMQSDVDLELSLRHGVVKTLEKLFDVLFEKGCDNNKDVDILVQLCNTVEDLSEHQEGKLQCGSSFISRFSLLAAASITDVTLQRAVLDALCCLVTQSLQNQDTFAENRDQCKAIFKKVLPVAGDYLVQATIVEILYRVSRRSPQLLEEMLEDTHAQASLRSLQQQRKPSLLSEIRNLVILFNENQGPLRSVYSFLLSKLVINGKDATCANEKWVDFSNGRTRSYNHVSFYAQPGDSYSEKGDDNALLLDVFYSNIQQIGCCSTNCIEIVVGQTFPEEIVPMGRTTSRLFMTFATEDARIINARIIQQIQKQMHKAKADSLSQRDSLNSSQTGGSSLTARKASIGIMPILLPRNKQLQAASTSSLNVRPLQSNPGELRPETCTIDTVVPQKDGITVERLAEQGTENRKATFSSQPVQQQEKSIGLSIKTSETSQGGAGSATVSQKSSGRQMPVNKKQTKAGQNGVKNTTLQAPKSVDTEASALKEESFEFCIHEGIETAQTGKAPAVRRGENTRSGSLAPEHSTRNEKPLSLPCIDGPNNNFKEKNGPAAESAEGLAQQEEKRKDNCDLLILESGNRSDTKEPVTELRLLPGRPAPTSVPVNSYLPEKGSSNLQHINKKKTLQSDEANDKEVRLPVVPNRIKATPTRSEPLNNKTSSTERQRVEKEVHPPLEAEKNQQVGKRNVKNVLEKETTSSKMTRRASRSSSRANHSKENVKTPSEATTQSKPNTSDSVLQEKELLDDHGTRNTALSPGNILGGKVVDVAVVNKTEVDEVCKSPVKVDLPLNEVKQNRLRDIFQREDPVIDNKIEDIAPQGTHTEDPIETDSEDPGQICKESPIMPVTRTRGRRTRQKTASEMLEENVRKEPTKGRGSAHARRKARIDTKPLGSTKDKLDLDTPVKSHTVPIWLDGDTPVSGKPHTVSTCLDGDMGIDNSPVGEAAVLQEKRNLRCRKEKTGSGNSNEDYSNRPSLGHELLSPVLDSPHGLLSPAVASPEGFWNGAACATPKTEVLKHQVGRKRQTRRRIEDTVNESVLNKLQESPLPPPFSPPGKPKGIRTWQRRRQKPQLDEQTTDEELEEFRSPAKELDLLYREGEQVAEDDNHQQATNLHGAVSMVAKMLKKLKGKVQEKAKKKTLSILKKTDESIREEIQRVEDLVNKDLETCVSLGKRRYDEIEANIQTQSKKVKASYESFTKEITQCLGEYDRLFTEVDDTELELKTSFERHRAAHEKLMTQAKQATEACLADAERRLVAVQKEEQSLKGLRTVLEGVLQEVVGSP